MQTVKIQSKVTDMTSHRLRECMKSYGEGGCVLIGSQSPRQLRYRAGQLNLLT